MVGEVNHIFSFKGDCYLTDRDGEGNWKKKKNSRMTMRQDHDMEKVWPKKGTVNHTVLSVNYVVCQLI